MYQASAQAAARALGRRIVFVSTTGEPDFEAAFAAVAGEKAAGLVVNEQPISIPITFA